MPEPPRRACEARLSRGAGLPEALPDVLGLAVRLLDAHGPDQPQDFLLVTSAEASLGRLAILPARRWGGRRYSSVLPYRMGGRLVWVGAATPRRIDGADLGRVEEAAAAGRLGFSLAVAPLVGPWRTVGRIAVGARLDDAEAESLRFNPWNTGGGIEPVGLLQRLRDAAYPASQAGRPIPDPSADARLR